MHHLSIHFSANHAGGDETKVYYIGLKGDFMGEHRSACFFFFFWSGTRPNVSFFLFLGHARTGVVNAVYESRPMMEDHKQDVKDLGLHSNAPQY